MGSVGSWVDRTLVTLVTFLLTLAVEMQRGNIKGRGEGEREREKHNMQQSNAVRKMNSGCNISHD